jgi:sulfoxide reductase catalytic subunit YedY
MLEAPFKRPGVFPPDRNQAYSLPADVAPRMTPRATAAVHNNFYEFIPGRGGPVWEHVEDFKVDPWKVVVSGECHEPQTLELDDLFGFDHEERVYHFRCVERWAMNVPWSGFPLSKLLDRVKPKASARFVRFLSALKPSQMPGVRQARLYPWPYHEALRMDEAMNELTLLATGVYGEPLLKQHGAPVRLVVPWKYGYKSPKSIVKIELVKKQPKTFWQIQAHEYGFLSNVNPYIPHPRWPQNRSHWLDSGNEFPTPLFNGYEKYVAALYPDEPRTLQRALRSGQIAR